MTDKTLEARAREVAEKWLKCWIVGYGPDMLSDLTRVLIRFAERVAEDERKEQWAYVQEFMEHLRGKPFPDDGSTFEDHLRTMLEDGREWAAQQAEHCPGETVEEERWVLPRDVAARIRKGRTP